LLENRFFALSSDLLCISALDGRIRKLNPAWERALGYSMEELLSRPLIDFVHPDDRARTLALIEPICSGKEIVGFDNRLVCKDGSIRWVSWTCSALRDGDPCIYSTGRDITAQRAAEERLACKSAEIEAIFKALPDLLFRTDAEGRIVDYSAGRPADLYTTPDEFLGKTFREVLPTPIGDLAAASARKAHQRARVESFEYDLDVRSGRQRFEARAVPFADGHTLMIVRNVTDRRRAQQALKVNEERLRESERLEAIGRLAGGIAHDFNNLMMVVLMYSDALLRKSDIQGTQREALLEIRGAGERATGLTRQLLAFARKQILSPTVLAPSAVVRDMEAMLRGLIGEHVALSCFTNDSRWCVHADRSQLEQVVLNLALNARDAMPRGGQLTIRLEDAVLDETEARKVDLRPSGQYVRLSVTDTGLGIDDDTRRHIFEPFFTTKAVGKGTGLGLATVYGIVRQSGGTIAVETAPGVGTTFTVHLPRADAPPSEKQLPEVDDSPHGTETILVVEDESAVRNAVTKALRRLGYQTLEAANAEAAIEVATSHAGKIHLLLTDIVMPGLSGYELAGQLASTRPDTRVVYMSGYPLSTGVPGWPPGPLLQKPFPPHKLAQCVRETLDAKTRG